MTEPNSHDRRILAETRYLRLVQEGHWTYAQRPNVTGAIGIVAVTNDDRLLLVEQYRIPVARRVIELPAGLVGDASEHAAESLEDATRRELLEETGYQADAVRVLLWAASSAGLTDECVHLMWAGGLQRVSPGGGHGGEQIVVHEVPCRDLPDWLQRQQAAGMLVDFRVYAALYFLQLGRSGRLAGMP